MLRGHSTALLKLGSAWAHIKPMIYPGPAREPWKEEVRVIPTSGRAWEAEGKGQADEESARRGNKTAVKTFDSAKQGSQVLRIKIRG